MFQVDSIPISNTYRGSESIVLITLSLLPPCNIQTRMSMLEQDKGHLTAVVDDSHSHS